MRAAVGGGVLFAYEEPGTETIRAPVLKVFDGDGFKTMLWNTQLKKACEVVVRLGFTDAPELEQPGGKIQGLSDLVDR